VSRLPERNVVNGRWRLAKRLGFGSFGDIYVALDEQNGKTYAAKVEKGSTRYPQLKFENKVYRSMYTYNGFPRAHWCGNAILSLNSRQDNMNVLIMDRLGASLESLYSLCDRKFGVKTVCMIGIQIVNRIQSLHSEGYLHRDIKPDNFLIGSGNRNKKDGSVIHMIDMGLAKSFRSTSGEHIPMRSGKRLTGTPRYASINTHNGLEQSRRDDLESLCYILIYFLRGKLPWQGMQGSTKATKYDLIRKKKMATSPEKLCQNLPEEFINFLNYVRKLEFTQEPDYKFLKKLLQLCCQRVEGTKIDWRFAWQSPHEKIETIRKRSICKEKDSDYKSDDLNDQSIQTPKLGKGSEKTSQKSDKTNTTKTETQAEDSVQCLSKPPPNKTQQKPHVVSTEKIREKDSAGPTMPTPEEQLRKAMEKFGGDAQRLMRSYYEIERERDELKKKCYAYEALNLKLKKDLENARVGRKRKKDRESGLNARAKRPRVGDPHSPIQIE